MVSFEKGKKKHFLVLPVFSPYSLSLASSLFVLNSQGTHLILGKPTFIPASPVQGRQQTLT